MADKARPGPRRTLSEQVILDAALALLADRGVDGVTIRGIATRVGVAPNAVYTYFPDKASVLRGLAEQLLGRVNHDRFIDPSLPWRDRVRALAVELRAELVVHPGAVHLMLDNPFDGPNARAVAETLLSIFAEAGLAPEDAGKASHLVNVLVLGSVAFRGPAAAEIEGERFRWGIDRLLDGLAVDAAAADGAPAGGVIVGP